MLVITFLENERKINLKLILRKQNQKYVLKKLWKNPPHKFWYKDFYKVKKIIFQDQREIFIERKIQILAWKKATDQPLSKK